MDRLLRFGLLLLIGFGLASSQVAGGGFGFVCSDQETLRNGVATHCHWDREHRQFAPCSHSVPSPDCPEGTTSHHVPVKGEVESTVPSSKTLVTAPPFVPAVPTDLAAFQWVLEMTRLPGLPGGTGLGEEPAFSLRPAAPAGLWADASVRVARCIVLLV